MESQHSVGWPVSSEFPRFVIISEISRPEIAIRWRFWTKHLKKDTLRENLQNSVPKGFIATQISTCCVQISWNLADRKSVKSRVAYLSLSLTHTNKISPHSLALASAQIVPTMCQGQRQTTYSECPKFHPYRFTSGGATAERVNTIKPRDKVNPILGEAIASCHKGQFISVWATNWLSLEFNLHHSIPESWQCK